MINTSHPFIKDQTIKVNTELPFPFFVLKVVVMVESIWFFTSEVKFEVLKPNMQGFLGMIKHQFANYSQVLSRGSYVRLPKFLAPILFKIVWFLHYSGKLTFRLMVVIMPIRVLQD